MDKLNIVNTLTNYVGQLRNTECSRKDKISCFQHIAECILSPVMVCNQKYSKYCNAATNVLLLFCEDLDSTVRMAAEENLNRIFRGFERTRSTRIPLDLYNEIKRNGNQRSLRICLTLFAYYSPQITERRLKWYATRLSTCLQIIAQRKETMLCETLCEFVKNFSKHLQMGLTDSETSKLIEVFIANLNADCIVKRRCSAQNCISLIKNSRNKSLMARHGLCKMIELLLKDQQVHTILGSLGLLRLLLPLIIRGFDDDCSIDEGEIPSTKKSQASTATTTATDEDTSSPAATDAERMTIKNECIQIIEIFDYCLHLLSTSHSSNHSIINAALDVINAILQAVETDDNAEDGDRNSKRQDVTVAKCLQQLLRNQQLLHNECSHLRSRKSLKNQIFHSKNYEMSSAEASATMTTTTTIAATVATKANSVTTSLMSTPTTASTYQLPAVGSEDGADKAGALTLVSPTITQQEKTKEDGSNRQNDDLNKHKTGVVSTVHMYGQLEERNDELALQTQKVLSAKTMQQEEAVLTATTTPTAKASTTTELAATKEIRAADDEGGNVADDVDADCKGDEFLHKDDEENPKGIPLFINIKVSNTKDRNNDGEADDNVENVTETTSIKLREYIKSNQRKTRTSSNNLWIDDSDDDDDDFTTLCEISEPQTAHTKASSQPVLPTSLDIVDVIDTIDISKVREQQEQGFLHADDLSSAPACRLALDEQPSQHLSDVDNESFNSIDFEAEIRIADLSVRIPDSRASEDVNVSGAVGANRATARLVDDAADNGGSSATFGSFFNNILTHTSTESLTKLFRPTVPKSTLIKASNETSFRQIDSAETIKRKPQESDGISIGSSASVSTSAETVSLGPATSIGQKHEEVAYRQNARKYLGSNNEKMPSTTPSIAVSVGTITGSTKDTATSKKDDVKHQEQPHSQTKEDPEGQEPQSIGESEVHRRRSSYCRKPNVNPFLKDSPLKQAISDVTQTSLPIGSINEQSAIYYAGRLVASRFLLTGQPGELQSDVTTRVSIKSLSLCVLAQCVRLEPKLLTLSLEISSWELQRLELGTQEQQASSSICFTTRFPTASTLASSQSSSKAGSPAKAQSDSSSNLDTDYEHLDLGSDAIDFTSLKKSHIEKFQSAFTNAKGFSAEQSLLLEIKDDHFGVSSSDYLLNQPLSRSMDTACLAAMSLSKDGRQQQQMSQSQIIGRTQVKKAVQHSMEDTVPLKPAPLPPMRTKSLKKRYDQLSVNSLENKTIIANESCKSPKISVSNKTPLQQISDVLLFYKHPDPILRGGVQQIIGNFIDASKATLQVSTQLPLSLLLAILMKGLEDDIHTVIIQALNAFDKTFPLVLAKYLSGSRICTHPLLYNNCCCPCHYEQLQHEQCKQSSERTDIHLCSGRTNNNNHNNGSSSNNSCSSKDPNDPNDVLRRKLCCRTCSYACEPFCLTAADRELSIDNDELIASILNSYQLKIKNNTNVCYLSDVDDNNGPHVDAGLYNKLNIDNSSATLSAATTKTAILPSEDADRTSPIIGITSMLQFFSPKFLLDKLRLCQQNKYWLVQNKYAEVITNLNYVALREYYVEDNDLVTTYEQIFLDELLQLIGEDDFRVREHAAECICRFIIQNAKQKQHIEQQQHTQRNDFENRDSLSSSSSSLSWTRQLPVETFQTNFNLLWDFWDYRIFNGMSPPLRNMLTVNSAMTPPLTASSASMATSTTPSTKATAKSAPDTNCNRYLAFNVQREMQQEEKILASVLYHLTNKLMDLNDKNSQFGIIYALRILLTHFNFLDYHRVWTECNLMEICLRFLYCNQTTAVDLNCQNDLIDVVGKLMAGYLLTNPQVSQTQREQLIDSFLTHIMKIMNIYFHIVTQQKPLFLPKVHKPDLFGSSKEIIVQKWGYFGNDYVYIKLYNLLKSANDIYKMTITQASGSILLSLLHTCINNLSLCIEMRSHVTDVNSSSKSSNSNQISSQDPSSPGPPITSALKLIEEILQYLRELIHLAAVECIACLRQLLKYLFAQNFGSHAQCNNAKFIQQVCDVRTWPQQKRKKQERKRQQWQQDELAAGGNTTSIINESQHPESDDWNIFSELFARISNSSPDDKATRQKETAKYIKIFEPMVVSCIALFMKSNAVVQASILELISDMLELHITYSTPDSKNIIFDEVIRNLELIESGIARNAYLIVPPMVKLLVQLTNRSAKLITMPKVISIINNLLANNAIRSCAVVALKSLAYEIFFCDREGSALAVAQSDYQRAAFPSPLIQPPTVIPDQQHRHHRPTRISEEAAAVAEVLLQVNRELDTQKEVVLGMLEKFIDAKECQQVLGLLLLRQRSINAATSIASDGPQQQECGTQQPHSQQVLQNPDAVFAVVCRALCEERICVTEWSSFFLLETFFRNCDKLVLADSKVFHCLLQWFIRMDVNNYSNLSCATIILEHVIPKTEEIYLINHVKLYMKNHVVIREENRMSYPQDTACLPEEPSTSVAAVSALECTLNNYNSSSSKSDINEMNFFANTLNEKLADCFLQLTAHSGNLPEKMHDISPDGKYCGIMVRFIRALRNVCCRSRLQDALQPALRLALKESGFLEKYFRFLNFSEDNQCVTRSIEESLRLQLEFFRLLSAVRLLDTSTVLKQLQGDDIKPNVRRALLREICKRNPLESNGLAWSLQQVQQLFHPVFLNALIADAFAFVCTVCEVDEEFCSSWLSALIVNYAILRRHSIRILVHSAVRFCARNSSTYCIAKFLSLLARLHHVAASDRDLEHRIERTARWLISSAPHRNSNSIYDCFIRMENERSGQQTLSFAKLQHILLNDLESCNVKVNLPFEQKIIDEKWLFSQISKCSTQSDCDPEKITRILLDIQSEHKLHKIFNSTEFNKERLLGPAITWSLHAMLDSFRNSCIQHNPHVHYLQPNPLARVACAMLMARIDELTVPSRPSSTLQQEQEVLAHLAAAVVRLMEAIKRIETTALIYIEAKFIEKFLREHLLRRNDVASLLRFLRCCCTLANGFLSSTAVTVPSDATDRPTANRVGGPQQWIYLRCIDVLLKQKFIWNQLHLTNGTVPSTTLATFPDVAIWSPKQRHKLLCNLVELLTLAAKKTGQTRRRRRRHLNLEGMDVVGAHEVPVRAPLHANDACLLAAEGKHSNGAEYDDDGYDDDNNVAEVLLSDVFPAAAFIAKLIETQIDIVPTSGTFSPANLSGRHRGGGTGIPAPPERAGASCSLGDGGKVAAAGLEVCARAAALHTADYLAGIETEGARVPMNLLISIGISILRVSQFYAFAVTPSEIVQLQQQQTIGSSSSSGSGTLNTPTKHQPSAASTRPAESKTETTKVTTACTVPTIPVESLSDVTVLRSFIKRLSIFGFVSRQQFEEHFMTLLLLINKVYDENLVDQQEQFQIKSTCLEAILELLITYKTFPIVGDKLSWFHHTARWSRINCDSISLKKLHKIQLLVSESNVFYHPNLERQLVNTASTTSNWLGTLQDNIKGTRYFLTNQMDLSFVWQQMESFAEPAGRSDEDDEIVEDYVPMQTLPSRDNVAKKPTSAIGGADDVTARNYIYFTASSGVDFKSSSQLIFDVMMQIIEYNHILVLPNLVKFCEICENRDQIKWIKDKALKMQETIPIDDTISHQHIIYLLCRTQATLIPTLGELQQLCVLVANYLRSSHVFIRNAALAGVLSLLECCAKTNTSIGKLSEELALLRELIVAYVQRHGLIDQSAIRCSTTHAKLVWTLTFALIEWTSKFVPQCNLLSNATIAAGQLLPRSPDEEVYLCILHGLERLIVVSAISGNNAIVPSELHHKIEKLALDLVKLENEKFSVPALKLLLSCMYVGSAEQLESTELSNGIVQDDPEIIAQQTDKVDVLLHCIKSSSRDTAWIYGQVLCQIIRDLVPPNEILTKVIKEFLAINQPHCDIIATVVYQVFRSAIDSSFLEMLQDWLICSLPTFLALPTPEGVWRLSVIFLSASINLHLIKLFPVMLGAREFRKLGQHEIALFVTAAQDFHAVLSAEQRMRFRDAFLEFQQNQIYAKMLQSL